MYYTTFALRCTTMKPFKIKAIKTYVSYITTFVILHIMRMQTIMFVTMMPLDLVNHMKSNTQQLESHIHRCIHCHSTIHFIPLPLKEGNYYLANSINQFVL